MKNYIAITKPGIIFGNAVTAIAGFMLASQDTFNLKCFVAMLVGISAIIASACIFNNYLDRHMDAKMVRTKNRPLVLKTIPVKNALIFAALLGLTGMFSLMLYTNALTLYVAVVGFFTYVVLYSKLKYYSSIATYVGSIAGASPAIVGYTAVQPHLNLEALILFSIVALWQMPHFFAISIYRLREYAAASIPVLPISKNVHTTKVHMFFYIMCFMLATTLLTLCGYAGYTFLAASTLLGGYWLVLCLQGFQAVSDVLWARKMFVYSLAVILTLCLILSLHLP